MANAQEKKQLDIPISIAYYGHYITHNGIKIGTQYDWKEWEKTKVRKRGNLNKQRKIFASPQIGLYRHPKNHTGLLFNVDIGYQRSRGQRKTYTAYALGLGYMTQINSGITYVYKSDDSLEEKKWASRGYFMPTLNTEIGRRINHKVGWYSKLSLGSKLNYNTGKSLEFFLELGAKINIKNKKG
ncbi:hypothetical protein AB832_02935, partial [Flavobacteriaceae bacterium (ex Bugula neritina AB1)]